MKFMGEISSGISHNFRNILAGIMTSLQLIQLMYPDDPNLQKYASGMIDFARNGNDVIGGLLKFARKESDRRKSVFNLADATNGKHVVSFSDNGCGMDEKAVKRVFDPFFTSKEPGRGTGLGLSIAYGIVKNQGGGSYGTVNSR